MSTGQPNVCLDGIIFGLQRNGGISNYWSRLLDAFSATPGAHWRTVIPKEVLFQHYRATWRLGQATVETLPAALSRYFPCPIALGDEVMHTSYYRLPSRPMKRYVVTAYDFMYERYRTGPALWMHSWQKRRSIERADIVLCISHFTRNEILEFLPAIEPQKLKVIPLGIDREAFYPDRKQQDSALERTVLFVGLRAGYKRFELAVEAVRAANSIGLGLVGPPLTPEETISLNLKLPGRWQHFGSVTSTRLRELYSSAYALIFPSDCEGFGLPVLESMACGCPVVASSCGSLPEVGGSAALYATEQNPADYAAALVALDSPSARTAAIVAGFAQIRSFSWNDTIAATRQAYISS